MTPRAHLAVFVVCLLLVGVYTYPLVLAPGDLLPHHHDPRLFGWVMLTIFRNLVTRPAMLFEGNAFYPFGNSLTYTEPLLTPALVAGPVFAATGNPVLAYNVTLLLAWATSGWAMYAVAFWLTRHHGAAAVAMLVFMLSPYRTDYHLEFQMQVAFGIPLAVYLLVRFLEEQRARHLAGFVAVYWLEAIAVWYYAVILGFGLALVALQYVALRWTGWRRRTALLAGLGAAVLGLAVAPVAGPFFLTRRELGFERSLLDARAHSADLLTYLTTGDTRLYRLAPVGHAAETALFLGFVALALVAASLGWLRRPAWPRGRVARGLAWAVPVALGVVAWAIATRGRVHVGPVRFALPVTGAAVALLVLALARHAAEGWDRARHGLADRRLGEREWVAILLVLALFAGLLSLGPVVHLGRRPIGPGLYAWLYPYLLPLHAVRVATRFGGLVVFAGALLAAFGVARLTRRLSPRTAAWLVTAAAAGLLVEYATFPVTYERATPVARPVDAVLRAEPEDVAVLELPTFVTDTDTDAMFRSLLHGKRLVNGFSGFVPDFVQRLSMVFTQAGPSFPVAEAGTALRRIYPLRYLVVRLGDPTLRPEWRAAWRALRPAPPPVLRFRGSYGTEDLYEVVPLPEQGNRLDRWVSYAFLRARPVLSVTLRPLAPDAGRDQWADILLNERPLRRLRLHASTTARVELTAPLHRVAPNVVGLRYGYDRPVPAGDARYRIGATGVTSPGDLLVRSMGRRDGNAAVIRFNGRELATDLRGYNLVALDAGGRLLGTARFDTFGWEEASGGLAAWLAGLPPGTIVAGAVKDDASLRLSAEGVDALRALGVRGDLRGRYREGHAFVGVKGAAAGSAAEAWGSGAVEVRVGRPDAADGPGLELTEFALSAPAGVR